MNHQDRFNTPEPINLEPIFHKPGEDFPVTEEPRKIKYITPDAPRKKQKTITKPMFIGSKIDLMFLTVWGHLHELVRSLVKGDDKDSIIMLNDNPFHHFHLTVNNVDKTKGEMIITAPNGYKYRFDRIYQEEETFIIGDFNAEDFMTLDQLGQYQDSYISLGWGYLL